MAEKEKLSRIELVSLVLALLTMLQIIGGFSRWLSPEEGEDAAQLAVIGQQLADVVESVDTIEKALPPHMTDYAVFKVTTQSQAAQHALDIQTMRERQNTLEAQLNEGSR